MDLQMTKSKETRKAWLDIVAIHNPELVKKLSALIQYILSSSEMSASKSSSILQESKYQNALGKNTIPI